MMEQREFTCIGCPMGCAVTVTLQNEEMIDIMGNTCKVGEDYVRKEITSPGRIVTSTVRVEGGSLPSISVKTQSDVPKDKIFAVIKALKSITLKAPVAIGDIVIENVCDTSVNIIATKNMGVI